MASRIRPTQTSVSISSRTVESSRLSSEMSRLTTATPRTRCWSSRSRDAVRDTAIIVPSLQSRCVVILPDAFAPEQPLDIICGSSLRSLGTIRSTMARPIASSAV